jgi:hypothetical protein
LKENTYPFLALIVLRQNKMTVVARIEGPIGKLLGTLEINKWYCLRVTTKLTNGNR